MTSFSPAGVIGMDAFYGEEFQEQTTAASEKVDGDKQPVKMKLGTRDCEVAVHCGSADVMQVLDKEKEKEKENIPPAPTNTPPIPQQQQPSPTPLFTQETRAPSPIPEATAPSSVPSASVNSDQPEETAMIPKPLFDSLADFFITHKVGLISVPNQSTHGRTAGLATARRVRQKVERRSGQDQKRDGERARGEDQRSEGSCRS